MHEKIARDTIDPWGDNLIQDYKKVVTHFGLEAFDSKQFPEPNRLMRRGITFAGRDLKRISECISKKRPFYALTGIQPSADKIHLGTRSVIENVKYFQEHGAKTYVLVADLESAATRGISVEEGKKRAMEFHIPAYLALGLDIEKTQFYFQSENPTTFRLAFEAAQKITLNEFKGAYGNPEPGKILAALAQFADMILPQELEKKPIPGIIPVGIDQEPHIRLCRDYLHKIESQKRFTAISSIYNQFMPSLDGGAKMSKSKPESAIFLPEKIEVASKAIKRAFTGGRATMEEQRRLGAEVDKDMVFELLKQQLVESDKELEKIRVEYASGKMLSGEIKQLAIEKMTIFLEKFDADMAYYQKHIKDVQFLGFE